MDVLKPFWLLAQTILGITGIGFLIGFHELGHFLFCKLFGIRTPSFSIGFGPTIFSKKIGETRFILAAIPLGGYVEIAGAAEVGQGEQKEAYSTGEGSFATKPYWQKFLVMIGGILFNLMLAYAIFIGIFATGLPKTPLLSPQNAIPVLEAVAEPSPLKAGDKILAINNKPIENNTEELVRIIRSMPNKNVSLLIERNGKQETIPTFVSPRPTLAGEIGTLNVLFQTKAVPPAPLFSALSQGIQKTNHFIYAVFFSFVHLFKSRDLSGVGGPLMVISQTVQGAAHGFSIFLILLAIISINLAILNMVPLPILDGGQLLFYTIEAIIRRPIPIKIKESIHIGSWLLIMGLILYLSLFDIAKIANPYIEAIKQLIGITPK